MATAVENYCARCNLWDALYLSMVSVDYKRALLPLEAITHSSWLGQDASGSSNIQCCPPRRQNHKSHAQATLSSTTELANSQTPAQKDSDTKPPTLRTGPTRNRRGAKFNSSLTETASTSTAIGSRSASIKSSILWSQSSAAFDAPLVRQSLFAPPCLRTPLLAGMSSRPMPTHQCALML